MPGGCVAYDADRSPLKQAVVIDGCYGCLVPILGCLAPATGATKKREEHAGAIMDDSKWTEWDDAMWDLFIDAIS